MLPFFHRAESVVRQRPISIEALEDRRLFAWVDVKGLGSWSPTPGSDPNGTYTFTASNLPAHTHIRVGHEIIPENMPPFTEGVDMTAGFGAAEVTKDYYPWCSTWDFAATAKHTGSSTTYTIGASGFGEEMYWYANVSFSLEVWVPSISVESEVIAVDGSEEVTITVVGPPGQDMEGVNLEVESSDSGIIAPQQSTVTTDEEGIAIVDVDGVAPGYADLQVKLPGGQPTTQPQSALKITTRDERPSADAINTQITRLGAEEWADREDAASKLRTWIRQFPDIRSTLQGARSTATDPEVIARIDTILEQTSANATLSGNQLAVDVSSACPEGETIWIVRVKTEDATKLKLRGPNTGQQSESIILLPPRAAAWSWTLRVVLVRWP